MFTPQRKGWLFSPKTSEKNGGLFGRGRDVLDADQGSTPRQNSGLVGEDGVAVEGKEREALDIRIAKLESELYDYQYNMGLLLIERKEWSSKYEEAQQELIDTKNALKQAHDTHLLAFSEIEAREVNLKKALDVEKQCVADLEKAIHEMRTELAEMKIMSDQKLQKAQTTMTNVEEKSLEVDAKLRFTEARISDVNRRTSELERKSQELSTREERLRREQTSFHDEKQLHLEDLGRQRDELQIWEGNLREGEERLVMNHSLLNQREKRINQNEEVLMKKEKDLELLREAIDKKHISLKEEEALISTRLISLSAKETETDTKKEILEERERNLLTMEEKLNERERVEIQKLLDDHAFILDAKKHEFDTEIETKKKVFDEGLQDKLASVEKREKEINEMESKLHKREQALEKKIEKMKDDQEELDIRVKSLNELVDATRTKEVQLEQKRKSLEDDNEKLIVSKVEIEYERKSLEAEKLCILSERENLKITEEERAEHSTLQLKLKHELDDCRILKETLAKEREELRLERENFEKEWDALDERRAALVVDVKKFEDEKEKLLKWKCTEDEKLNNEKMAARDYIQNEMSEVEREKEAFQAIMEHERSELHEMLRQEHVDMARNIDIQKHELDISMQKKIEELENQYQEKLSEFNEQRNAELKNINSLREAAALETQKMKLEQIRFEREKQDYVDHRKKFEQNQLEIQRDIETLHTLSGNLKYQREQFIKDRDHFSDIVKKFKSCKNCGAELDDFILLDFQAAIEIKEPINDILPSANNNHLISPLKSKPEDITSPFGNHVGSSGGRMSWLRTCTRKIFSLSPGNKPEDCTTKGAEISNALTEQLNVESSSGESDDSINTEQSLSEEQTATASKERDQAASQPDPSMEVCKVPADIQSDVIVNRVIEPIHYSNGENKIVDTSPILDVGIQNQVKKKKTRTVRAIKKQFVNTTNRSSHANKKKGDLRSNYQQGASVGQKRNFSQASATSGNELDGDNEAHLESTSHGGSHRQIQTSAHDVPVANNKGYNFRRSTVVGKTAAAKEKYSQTKGTKTRKLPESSLNKLSIDVEDKFPGTPEHKQPKTCLNRDIDGSLCLLHHSTTESIMEVQECSLQNLVEVGAERVDADGMVGEQRGNKEMNEAEATTNQAASEDSCRTKDGVDDNDDDLSDSEEYNGSVGKKLWRFLTT